MLTRKKILISVALAALFIRIIFALQFFNSFFAAYHLVPGLDMQTLLRYSEWSGSDPYPAFFTFHRLVIYLCYLCNRQIHAVWAVFAIQTAVGIAGCICLTDIILKFTGKRRAALICGFISASYLPFLVYEFSILKETFAVNFALFTFWCMLNALRKRFNWSSSLLFGFSAFATIEGRLAVMPYLGALALYCAYKMYKRKQFCKIFRAALLPLLLLPAASAFNKANGWKFSPFFDIVSYTVSYNTGTPESSAEAPASSVTTGLLTTVKQAASRIPAMFKYGELPENQNIYFWCEKLPLLDYFPAPGLIIPLAVAGIMIVIFSGSWKKRYGLLLLPLITMVLPLCAREPIGRYRLMLVPYLFIITASAVVIFFRIKDARMRGAMLFAAAIGVFFSIHNGDVPQKIRPHDYSAWAMAMENSDQANDSEVLAAYFDHWKACNFRSETAFFMFMDKCLEKGRIDLAAGAAKKAWEEELINPDYIHYYMAWCFALREDPHNVYSHLLHVLHPEDLPPDMYQKYTMLLNDTHRILTIMEN